MNMIICSRKNHHKEENIGFGQVFFTNANKFFLLISISKKNLTKSDIFLFVMILA